MLVYSTYGGGCCRARFISRFGGLNNPSESAYVAVCLEVLPSGLLGITIAGFFAATMSSLDTSLNVNAGFLVKNFYQLFLGPAHQKKNN